MHSIKQIGVYTRTFYLRQEFPHLSGRIVRSQGEVKKPGSKSGLCENETVLLTVPTWSMFRQETNIPMLSEIEGTLYFAYHVEEVFEPSPNEK